MNRCSFSRFLSLCSACFYALSIVWCSPVGGQERETKTLRIGYSLTTLMSVNAKDAEMATNILLRLIAKETGRDIAVETKVFADLEEMAAEIAANRLDLVSVVSEEYLQLAEKAELNPVFVPERNGSVYEELLLLVHKENLEAGLDGLAQKKMLLGVNQTIQLPYWWLDSILHAAGLPSARDYFASIEEVRAPARAVLPVFFGQADACMTISSEYEMLKTLNPQLARNLVVLHKSEPMLMSVLCLNGRMDPDLAQLVRDELPRLDRYAEGRQLLMLFGVDSHTSFREEYLAGVEHFIAQEKKLRADRAVP